MKPKMLKIMGLNSFEQEQSIDFETLTSEGLFVIAGRTGSGKTSIIDAITLALYDKVVRVDGSGVSLRQCINQNTKKMYISFTFELNNEQYTVERYYKDSKHTFEYKNRLIKITDTGDLVVLADKVDSVNKKIKNIIGLSFDDFSSAVVLPQGNFSKFLLLKNKERRDMLERIFNLQSYGERLNSKVKTKLDMLNTDIAIIDTELKQYKNISEQQIDKYRCDILKKNDYISRLKEHIDYNVHSLFNKKEHKSNLDELLRHETSYKQLMKKENMICDIDNNFKRSRQGNSLKPLVVEVQDTKAKLVKLQNVLKDIEQKLKDVNAWRDKINMEYEDISGKQNNIYPKLLKQKIELSRALKDEYTVKVLHKEILRLKKEHDKLVVTNKHLSINIEKKDKLKTELNNTLESILSRYRSLIIDKDMKKAINEAVKLTEKKNMLTEEIDANLLVLKDKEIIYLSINDRLLTLKRQYDISSNELMDKEDILDKLQRDDMESILLRIRDSVKKLREEPGGSYLLLEEECLKDVDIILRPVNILSEKNIKDFKHPDSTKKLYSISIDFKGLADILSNKKKLKEQLQNAVGIMRKSINEIGIELGMLTKDKSHAQERISEIKLKIESSNTELKRISDKLTEFKNILGFSDFINKKDELDKQEEEAYKLSIDAEGIRETISLINKELDSLKLKLSDLNVDIANIKTQGKEKKDNMETILSSIKQLNLDNNISEELNKVSVELNTLEKNFNRLRLELQNATDMKQNLEKDYSVIVGEIRALNPALKDKENRLYKEISQSEFASEDEVLEACLDKDMENKMALEVTDFYDDKKRLAGLIASLEDKLQLIDRQSIVKDIDVLSTRLNILRGANDRHTRDLAVITERLRQAQADIVILKELLNKRDMEVGKKKLLDELSKIFYGNRFVEFVSKRQLIYISEQASERLGDISHNRYAIELDDNNDFIIRDNFNGGLRRSPKTLSGGETFVVSLCLALALSSSIQLKSKCGLDFFFLDEGFGTLDSVLLDVVMEALDSLRKQRIKIGLITHVEEIKARIQKKLIVTKADHGEYGSKVKLVL